jgi:hypothetical protein
MAADKYTLERMKDKSRVVSPSIHFRPKQLERLEELARVSGMLARSGRRKGEPSLQNLLSNIADLPDEDIQVLGEFVRKITRDVVVRSPAERAQDQLDRG